jgi:hypothetical protein
MAQASLETRKTLVKGWKARELFRSAVADICDTLTRSWLVPTKLSQPRYLLAGVAAAAVKFQAGASAVVDVFDTSTRTYR